MTMCQLTVDTLFMNCVRPEILTAYFVAKSIHFDGGFPKGVGDIGRKLMGPWAYLQSEAAKSSFLENVTLRYVNCFIYCTNCKL